MIIALAEYARLHNRSGDTLRRLAENGSLKTAQKSEEIGQLIVKKSIRQKEKRSQNPLLLFPCFPVVAEWI